MPFISVPKFATTFRAAVGTLAVVTLTAWGAGIAQGNPEPSESVTEPQLPTAAAPIAVSGSEYSYLATHSVTNQASDMKLPDAVASLPVPQQYRPANLALADQFDRALTSALGTPGGCLQVVVDPAARDGNLFNYGFFPVSGEYCH